jgi:central kinetochore subunit Mal2/MCM21
MSTTDDLDAEITSLKSRLFTLHAHRANLTSILLSQPHLSTRLQTPTTKSSKSDPALAAIHAQHIRNITNTHRACASVTAYKVLDPDPRAQNGGHILGISIDVALRGKFVETYHVLFSYTVQGGEKVLRVHKHTIPPCVPLQALANKWLPGVGKDKDGGGEEEVKQDLVRFGKRVRRELVGWHLRVDAVEALRREAGLSELSSSPGEEPHHVLNAFTGSSSSTDSDSEDEAEDPDTPANIIDIESDTAVRQITITWSNRRTAVLSVSKDGRVDNAVVRMKDGTRDLDMGRKALGPVGGLVRRLKA